MHFLNPVPVMALVEIVRTRNTSTRPRARWSSWPRNGTRPLRRTFPGFVWTRILMPFINEAVWALHGGVAEPQAIDTIAKLGFDHPMGPLALADLSASTPALQSWSPRARVRRRALCACSAPAQTRGRWAPRAQVWPGLPPIDMVAQSPYSAADLAPDNGLPAATELDFALLRVDTSSVTTETAATRGWVDLARSPRSPSRAHSSSSCSTRRECRCSTRWAWFSSR